MKGITIFGKIGTLYTVFFWTAYRNSLTLIAKILIAAILSLPLVMFISSSVFVKPLTTLPTRWNKFDYVSQFSPNDENSIKQPLLLVTYMGKKRNTLFPCSY